MKRPNILLVMPDRLRADWLPYPKQIKDELKINTQPINVPNIKKLMDNGTTFLNAFTPSPSEATGVACLAAGLRYDKCNVLTNQSDYPLWQPTFYNALKKSGYLVGALGKLELHKNTMHWGMNGWTDVLGRLGFTHALDCEDKFEAIISAQGAIKGPYIKYLNNKGFAKLHLDDIKLKQKQQFYSKPSKLTQEYYIDNWLTQNALYMLKSFDKGKPWFMQVSYSGPNSSRDITEEMHEKWKAVSFSTPTAFNMSSHEDINALLQAYSAMLENVDIGLGMLLEELEDRVELENTVIIFAGAHGDMLGDLNLFGHDVPYNGATKIPLIISGPGIKRGVFKRTLVELQDINSTICRLANCEMIEAVDSLSLIPALTEHEKQEERHYIISGLGDWRMVCDGEYKAVFSNGNPIMLYNLKTDPYETDNLVAIQKDMAAKLKQRLIDSINTPIG